MTWGPGVTVRDAVAGALMGTGGVVVLLVVGQEGAQVRLAEDQGPVHEFAHRVKPVSRLTPDASTYTSRVG